MLAFGGKALAVLQQHKTLKNISVLHHSCALLTSCALQYIRASILRGITQLQLGDCAARNFSNHFQFLAGNYWIQRDFVVDIDMEQS